MTDKTKKYKLIARNKKANMNFFIEDKYQAGISLLGGEVKSLRGGRCNITESYISVKNGEAFILNMHISPYEHDSLNKQDPARPRKLLLHKREINRLIGAVSREGYTIVPLKIYFDGSYVKVDIGLGKGKKLFDKRRDIAKKDQKREMERALKQRNRE